MSTQSSCSSTEVRHKEDEDRELFRWVETKLAQVFSLSADDRDWVWTPLMRGGSDRDFDRIQHLSGGSWIIMRYSTEREENILYADIAQFLMENHLNVPRLIFHEANLRVVILEDLGDESLHSVYSHQPESDRLKLLYQAALDQAKWLHRHISAPVRMMNGFDEKLYRWERHYFLDYLVSQWAGIQLADTRWLEIEKEGEDMVSELIETPRCLVHRDFQSQNLMVRGDTIWLIDFQGMRLGHAAYDVASLLYDPYVKLSASWRTSLLNGYTKERGFERLFYRAAAQRLMQALGAYGFLGLIKGKKSFLEHIPRALENLEDILQHLHGMDRTCELVRQIRSERG